MTTPHRAVSCPVVVGRDDVLGRLDGHARDAAAQGRVTLFFGEAGVGKTRLASTAADVARTHGHVVLMGGSRRGARDHEPFTSALTQYEATLLPAESDLLFSGRARPARILVPTVFTDAAGAATSASQVHVGTIELLRRMSQYTPVTLVLEDLHWAGRDALDLLLAVTVDLPDLPVWIVATHRADERIARQSIEELVAIVERRTADEHVLLDPLDRAGVRDMVMHLFPRRRLPEDFVTALHQRSHGVPFVVEELCRALLAQGTLRGSTDAITSLDLPDTVRTTLLARLEQVQPRTRELLTVAAVDGQEVDPVVLGRALGWGDDDVKDAVTDAVDALLLDARPSARHGQAWAFTHALTREAIASDLDPRRHRQIHAALAEALAEEGGDEVAGAVCDHLVAAGETERAFPHALAAARHAAAGLRPSEAGTRYEQAVTLAPDTDRLAVAVEAAEFGFYADRPRAVPLAERAYRLAQERGDRDHEVRSLVVLARTRWIVGDPDAFAPFERALDMASGRGDRHELVVLIEAAYHLARTGWLTDAMQADELLRRADPLMDRYADPVLHSRAWLVRAARAGSLQELDRACRRAAVLVAETGRPIDTASVDLLAGHHLLLFHGDLREATRRLERYQRVWQDLSTRRPPVPFSGLAMGTLWMGDLAGAQALLAEGCWKDSSLSLANWHEAMSQFELARGHIAEARRHAREMLEIVRPLDEPSSLIPALANLGNALLESDGLEAASPCYREACSLADRSSLTYHWSFSPTWAEALARAGQVEDLAELADRLGPMTARGHHRGHDVAALHHVRGVHATSVGAYEQAAAEFAEAAARYRAMPFPARHAAALLAWADSERAAGATERAVALGREALGEIRGLERAAARERIVRRLRELGPPGQQAVRDVLGPVSLTPREREVVRLVAEGLTARQIADRLVISHRTVEGHVEHARDKLGASSRAELVRLAIQHGLTGAQ